MQMTKIGSDGRSLSAPKLAAFLDEKTGLMWAAEDVSTERLNYADAEKAVANFRAANFSDWRLPTIFELETLRDLTRVDPAADPELNLKAAAYWTSTPAASSPAGCAWIVYFFYGYSYWHNRDFKYFVRAVRSASQ